MFPRPRRTNWLLLDGRLPSRSAERSRNEHQSLDRRLATGTNQVSYPCPSRNSQPHSPISHSRNFARTTPNVVVLPFAATEPHGNHLPYGTDIFETAAIADRACELAHASRGPRRRTAHDPVRRANIAANLSARDEPLPQHAQPDPFRPDRIARQLRHRKSRHPQRPRRQRFLHAPERAVRQAQGLSRAGELVRDVPRTGQTSCSPPAATMPTTWKRAWSFTCGRSWST